MIIDCVCEKKSQFKLKKADADRLMSAGSTGQRMVMIQCGVCAKTIPINPQTLQLPAVESESQYTCPTPGCDGHVVHVESGRENFWGCGECGSVWPNLKSLTAAGGLVIER